VSATFSAAFSTLAEGSANCLLPPGKNDEKPLVLTGAMVLLREESSSRNLALELEIAKKL
jgi:hypothetical protein